MIELKDIVFGDPKKPAITVPYFAINQGDVIGVIGPSGSGKSCLLRSLLMLEPYKMTGQVLFDGTVVSEDKNYRRKARKSIGYLPQNLDLFSTYTVIENVMLPQIDLLGKSKQEAFDNALSILKRVGLAKRLFSYPDELSTSEKQRAAIARAISMESEFLVFDEPTALLDRSNKKEIHSIIKELVKNGATLVFVTNETSFAREICNRIVYIDENTIYEEGSVKDIFENPSRPRTKQFIKSLSLLEIQIKDTDFDFYGVIGRVDRFITDKSASKKASTAINFVFEELAKNILLPRLSKEKEFSLNMIYEYDSKESCFTITTRYTGEHFSPDDTEDDLALMILKHSASEYSYEEINEGNYKNKVTIKIAN